MGGAWIPSINLKWKHSRAPLCWCSESGQCLGLLLGGTIFVRVYCTAGISAHQVNIIITSPFVLVCDVFSATDWLMPREMLIFMTPMFTRVKVCVCEFSSTNIHIATLMELIKQDNFNFYSFLLLWLLPINFYHPKSLNYKFRLTDFCLFIYF